MKLKYSRVKCLLQATKLRNISASERTLNYSLQGNVVSAALSVMVWTWDDRVMDMDKTLKSLVQISLLNPSFSARRALKPGNCSLSGN